MSGNVRSPASPKRIAMKYRNFPNTDLRLWPGQFTRVSLRLSTLTNATVIPSQAVQT